MQEQATHQEGTFAAAMGAKFNNMTVEPIVEQCTGCDRAKTYADGTFCQSFPMPAAKWRRGRCNMATHVKTESKVPEGKVRVGQQKQRKK